MISRAQENCKFGLLQDQELKCSRLMLMFGSGFCPFHVDMTSWGEGEKVEVPLDVSKRLRLRHTVSSGF